MIEFAKIESSKKKRCVRFLGHIFSLSLYKDLALHRFVVSFAEPDHFDIIFITIEYLDVGVRLYQGTVHYLLAVGKCDSLKTAACFFEFVDLCQRESKGHALLRDHDNLAVAEDGILRHNLIYSDQAVILVKL